VVITTTPKPRELLRTLLDDEDAIVTGGPTYDNTANLSEKFIERITRRYEGTRTGRQELYAELLDEAEGALWKRDMFDSLRLDTEPELRQVVIGVDPAASNSGESSETGIVVVGRGTDLRGYVLEDISGRMSPDGWARRIIFAYHQWGANVVVAEKNNGGDMVDYTLQATAAAMHAEGLVPMPSVPVRLVWASKGKYARAEPVAALYEQKRISHVGSFPALEDQCCTWEPTGSEGSPDRLDALVWGFTFMMLGATVEHIDSHTLNQEGSPMVSTTPDWQLNDEGMF
jgi:predicted phage terminase large subunit-like protein